MSWMARQHGLRPTTYACFSLTNRMRPKSQILNQSFYVPGQKLEAENVWSLIQLLR